MREIKFRAWDGKRMTTSGIMFNNSTGCLDLPQGARMKLMQFTGLTDKNGVEIYESDIVRIIHQNDAVAVVKYEQQACQYWAKWEDLKSQRNRSFYKPLIADFGGDTYSCSGFEVIGNIYENPELLKYKL